MFTLFTRKRDSFCQKCCHGFWLANDSKSIWIKDILNDDINYQYFWSGFFLKLLFFENLSISYPQLILISNQVLLHLTSLFSNCIVKCLMHSTNDFEDISFFPIQADVSNRIIIIVYLPNKLLWNLDPDTIQFNYIGYSQRIPFRILSKPFELA